jgi:hypothetical protein
MKLDEKLGKIAKYEAQLKMLEKNSGAQHQKLEGKFEGQLHDISRKHENHV